MNDLTIFSSTGLFALAALAIPLLIHLFHRSRGKLILVGQVALYRQDRHKQSWRVRIHQWHLLVLRLLLLTLAALLLAGLAISTVGTVEGDVAYVTPDWLASADDDQRRHLTQYDEVRVLMPGYPELPAGATDPGDGPRLEQGYPSLAAVQQVDSWSLLAERLTTLRHDGEVAVYGMADAAGFPPAIGELPRGVSWYLEPRDPKIDPPPIPALSVHIIHEPERLRDAQLLTMALDTIAAYRRVTLDIQQMSVNEVDDWAEAEPTVTPSTARRVVIWLAQRPLPSSINTDMVLKDSRSGVGPSEWVRLPTSPQLMFLASPGVSAPQADLRVHWRTMQGAPLLVERHQSTFSELTYLDRFDTRPDGLAGNAVFPDVLLRLLMGEERWDQGFDRAPVTPPAIVSSPGGQKRGPWRSLTSWLAFVMALLFGLERWLSEKPALTAAVTESAPRATLP